MCMELHGKYLMQLHDMQFCKIFCEVNSKSKILVVSILVWNILFGILQFGKIVQELNKA